MKNSTILGRHYMDIVYTDVQKTLSIAENTPTTVTDARGEILYQSVVKLLTKINLTEDDIIFDLGSGMGKIVLQFFLQTDVREATGIELAPTLHQRALAAAQRVEQDLPMLFSDNRKLNFILGNFLEIPFGSATVLVMNSTCYSQDMLIQLGEIINACKDVCYVLSLRPLLNLVNLTLNSIVRIQCSWDAALCYIYSKPRL